VTPGGEQVGFSVADRLAALEGIPTLVLWGNQDRVICWRDALRIRAQHPATEVHIADGVGHMLPLEAPAWTNARIRAFCDGLSRALPRAA